MAETYSVEAVLSAYDKGFTKGMKNAEAATDSLGAKLKKGIGFGAFMSIGNTAVNAVTRSFTGMISEMSSSSAAWQTFEGNMKNFGKANQIPKVRKELQTFAQETIYSSSDMASTYAQMAAVGVKSADKLVMGFGGLASAAENPTQAMKTLSQQATQMAAKPTVQWMDFKLMLEQTPAGIAGVAKAMGKTSSQLIKDVQAGKVKTDDFFNAITRVGTSDAWAKQARQYKTVGQAMDGLKETMGNKLLPIFNSVSKIMIDDISKLTDASGKLNTQKIGDWITKHADQIRNGAKAVGALVVALTGMKIVNSIVGTFGTFVGNIKSLANPKLLGKLIPNLTATAAGETAVGTASKTSAKDIMAAGVAFLALGGGVALVAVGFAIMAKSAVQVAAAGPAAIAVLAGMVVSLGLLMVIASKVGPTLTAGAVGFVAFGAAVALVGVGMLLMATAAVKVAQAGTPAIAVMVGMGVAIVALGVVVGALAGFFIAAGVALAVFGAGLLVVGAAGVVCGAAMTIMAAALPTVAQYGASAAVGMAAFGAAALTAGAGALVAGAGMLVLGAGAVVASAGMVVLAVATKIVASQTKTISKNASSGAASLKAMVTSISVVNSGLDAMGSKVKSAMDGLISRFRNAAGQARSAGQQVGTGFAAGMSTGLGRSQSLASTAVNKVTSKLRSGRSAAHKAGTEISEGFALGMEAYLGRIKTAAAKMADAADKAVRAKAKIGSPSRVQKKNGKFVAKGLALGIKAGRKEVANEAIIMAKSVSGKLSKSARKSKKSGVVFARNVGSGMRTSSSTMKKTGQSMAKNTFTAFQKATGENNGYKNAADQLGSSFEDSYRSKTTTIMNKETKSMDSQFSAREKSIQTAMKKTKKGSKKYKKLQAELASTKKLKSTLSSKYTKAYSAAVDKVVSTVQNKLGAIADTYQAKYDEIASKQDNLKSKLSDYGSLFSNDKYGFVKLKDFKAATAQANAYAANLKKLKGIVSTGFLDEIQKLDTSEGLAYTNELLKMNTSDLQAYGATFDTFLQSAATNSNEFYKSYFDDISADFQSAVSDAMAQINTQIASVAATLNQTFAQIGIQAAEGLSKGISSSKSTKKVKKSAKKVTTTAKKSTRKKLKSHSPSRVFWGIGEDVGAGFALGIAAMHKTVSNAAEKVMSLPEIITPKMAAPNFAGAYAGGMSSDYNYSNSAAYTIVVPVEIDGKETAKVIAPYTEAELNKRSQREDRRNGRV